MKRLFTFFLATIFSLSSFAQAEWCGTEQMLNEYLDENPEVKAKFIADEIAMANVKPKQRKSGSTIVPVVVHVIHYNGEGNISEAQILDGLRILNEDFNKLNADTSTIRPIFQNLAVSMDIEFRLAKKDPQGNCTSGITRWNSYLSQGPSNRQEPKTVVQWDPFRYLNIWIVNQFSQAGLLGFAQFPGSGPLNRYGFMLTDQEWGTIGTGASGTGGRTASHEMGHCFNLRHPFQSGCGSNCATSGDFICDVPPQANDLNNRCRTPNNTEYNTCSNDQVGGNASNSNPFTSNVEDMVENVMGYGLSCISMMTPGQKNRMHAAFSFFALLDSLTNANTGILTGTNNGYIAPTCPPIAEVLTYDRFVCAGTPITFTDDSYGATITNYSWSFPGGNPSTSTQAQPSITYSSEGTYDVILRVSNAGGTDSVVLQNYVHVTDTNAYSAFNYSESFENASRFNDDWVSISLTAGESFITEWDRATFAAKTGNASVWLQNLASEYVGGVDQLISPAIKMTDVLNPTISFEVSYRRTSSTSDDQLRLLASVNCGETWSTIFNVGPNSFAYDNGTSSGNFIPTQGNQWRTVSIPSGFLQPFVKNSDRVKFMFELEHGEGNNIFIDDFTISGQPVGVGEKVIVEEEKLKLYPNPTEDLFNIVYSVEEAGQHRITLRNIVGEKVMEIYDGTMSIQEYTFNIDGSELSKGIYFLTVEGNSERITEKVVIR